MDFFSAPSNAQCSARSKTPLQINASMVDLDASWPVGDRPVSGADLTKLPLELGRINPLRNAFEHFDEDLDRFLIEDPVGCFFPTPLVDDHELADDELGNTFKLVDPVHGICVLLGEKYDFANIRGEVRRILTKARHMSGSGGRLSARG